MAVPMQIEYGQARGVLFSPTFLPATATLFQRIGMPLGAAHAAHPKHAELIQCLINMDCDNLEMSIAQGCGDVSVFGYVIWALRERLPDKRFPKPCYIIQDLLGKETDFQRQYLSPGCVITDAQVEQSGALSFGFVIDATLVNASSASPFVNSPGRSIDVLLTSITYRQDGAACCKCVPFCVGSFQQMQEDMSQYAANTFILKHHFQGIQRLLQLGRAIPKLHVLSPRSRDHARFVVDVVKNIHLLQEVVPPADVKVIKDGLLKCINIHHDREILKIVGQDGPLESGCLATCCVVKSRKDEGLLCCLGSNDNVVLGRKEFPHIGAKINFPVQGSPLSLIIEASKESEGRHATLGGLDSFQDQLLRQFNIQQSRVPLPDCFFDNSSLFQECLAKFWPSVILKHDESDSTDNSLIGRLSGFCNEIQEALNGVPELRHVSRFIDPSIGDLQHHVHKLCLDLRVVHQIKEGCGDDQKRVLVELCGEKNDIYNAAVLLEGFREVDIVCHPQDFLEFIQNQDRTGESSLKTRIEIESGAEIIIELDKERMIIKGEPDKRRKARSIMQERVVVEQLDMHNVGSWFPGVIIGTKGGRIREFELQTRTYIRIIKNPDVQHSFQIVGSPQNVAKLMEELPYRRLGQDISKIMAPVIIAQKGRLEKQTKAYIGIVEIGENLSIEIYGNQKLHVTEAYDAIMSLHKEQSIRSDTEGDRTQTSPSRARSRSKSTPRTTPKVDMPQACGINNASRRCPTPPPPPRSIPPPPPSSRAVPPPPPPSSSSIPEDTPPWRRQESSRSSQATSWNNHVPTKWDSNTGDTWRSKKPKRDEWSNAWNDDEWRRASWDSNGHSWNPKRSQSFNDHSHKALEQASESKVRGAESNPPLQCNAASSHAAKDWSWGSKIGADNFPCIYLLDGKNIMMASCSQQKPAKRHQFDFKKLYLALDYYHRDHGHNVKIFLTELQNNEKASFHQELKQRGLTQDIVVTCPRDKDDNIMFTHAKALQAEHGRHRVHIVTNDKFKDWIGRGQVDEDWVSDHCIQYSFELCGGEPSRFLPERSAGDPKDKSGSASRYQNM